jgi:hypothetical protein
MRWMLIPLKELLGQPGGLELVEEVQGLEGVGEFVLGDVVLDERCAEG